MAESSNTRVKAEEVAALGARIDRAEERLAVVRRQVAQRERQEPRRRLRSRDVHDRITVHRDGIIVTVEHDDGGAGLDETLRACKDAVAALGYTDDHVAEVWLKVHYDWMTGGRDDFRKRVAALLGDDTAGTKTVADMTATTGALLEAIRCLKRYVARELYAYLPVELVQKSGLTPLGGSVCARRDGPFQLGTFACRGPSHEAAPGGNPWCCRWLDRLAVADTGPAKRWPIGPWRRSEREALRRHGNAAKPRTPTREARRGGFERST